MEDWIKNLKAGDKVLTIEKGIYVEGIEPDENGLCILETVSTVVSVSEHCIETTFVREYNPAWVNFDRAYKQQTVLNYVSPTGEINIKQIVS